MSRNAKRISNIVISRSRIKVRDRIPKKPDEEDAAQLLVALEEVLGG